MKKDYLEGPSVQNKYGDWVPAIPLPFYSWKKICDCGMKFWTMESYQGHYALKHILGL